MNGEQIYDAIVVGSGAAGGWAVKELCERGLKTLLLEAGRQLDLAADFPSKSTGHSQIQLLTRVKAVLGGQHVQARCMSFSPQTKHFFIRDSQNPYTVPRGMPFNWYRARQVGGRLHLWGRNAIRISDDQLKPASRDGFGQNWPIGYNDLDPWYDKVETFLGVLGSPAGIPSIPDGKYESAYPITSAERKLLHDLAEKWPDCPATTCRIVKHNPERLPLPIRAAQETGKLTLRSDAVVSQITVDDDSGMATGVCYVDRKSKQQIKVRGRTVILGASTIESLRILLNSRSVRHPNGIGNSAGLLGRYLTDHVMVFRAGPLQPLEPITRADPYDFGVQSGIYIPSFRNVSDPHQMGFLRGYSMLGSVGRIQPGWFFMAIGEMLPRFENYVALDDSKRDAYGIPAARITCAHSDNEKAMVSDMKGSLDRLAMDCGLRVDHLENEGIVSRAIYKFASKLVYTEEGALVPGSAIHECGGACMGDDPATSVLNQHNQCWDAPNVLVTDSASFTTAPFQNPGLTIMALSARAGHFVADQLAGGAF